MTATLATPPAQRPWLAHYPEGMPADIGTAAFPTLVELLEDCFRRHADRDAAICLDARLSYRALDEASQALGAWLQSLGLARGARVALMMPNLPQYMVAIAAVLRAGFVVVNVNPLYTARELEHQLKDSGAQAIVVLENFAATLQQVLAQTEVRHVVLAAMGDMLGPFKGALVNFVVRHAKKLVPEFRLPAGDGRTVTRFNDALAQGGRLTLRHPALQPDDLAFLQYTGGTTGVSKGAMLLHRNVVANILQSDAWFQPSLARFGGKPIVMVCALPLYHIFALTACNFLGLRLGMTNLLVPNPRDIPGFVKTLAKQPVHILPAVNTLYNALLDHPDFRRLDFSQLAVCNSGGMAVQQATAQRWHALTGVWIVEGYGLSETSPVATCNRLDVDHFTGSVGLPMPSTEIAIRDDEGVDQPPGQPGEICIRGPQVMAGYWRRPDETANVMTPDGFFRSGDIGLVDERGEVRIVDRKKDMILVSGFNVYPTEVEQVVNLHAGVLESAAIGVPDDKSGEAVKLFVVRREGSHVDEDELMRHCRENLTAYKRPRHIEFRDELPKSNVGKILRRELRRDD